MSGIPFRASACIVRYDRLGKYHAGANQLVLIGDDDWEIVQLYPEEEGRKTVEYLFVTANKLCFFMINVQNISIYYYIFFKCWKYITNLNLSLAF